MSPRGTYHWIRTTHSAMSDFNRPKPVRINRIIHFALKLSFFQFRFLKICTLLVLELQVRLLNIYSPITIYLADVILWLLSRQSPVNAIIYVTAMQLKAYE